MRRLKSYLWCLLRFLCALCLPALWIPATKRRKRTWNSSAGSTWLSRRRASAAGQTVTYGITISSVYGTSSSSANAATLCNDIPNSALYTSPSANFSATAKICHFGCYRSYFQNQISQNRCASQFTSIMTTYTNCLPLAWLVTCTDTTLYNCLNSCFRTGTVLP